MRMGRVVQSWLLHKTEGFAFDSRTLVIFKWLNPSAGIHHPWGLLSLEEKCVPKI